MHFFEDHIYRKYMSDEMDEHEFVKRLKVAFEQEAKLHPEKKSIIYEGNDITLIHLVCEEYLSTIQFQKEVASLKGSNRERMMESFLIEEEPSENETENNDVLSADDSEPIIPMEEIEEEIELTADKKSKIARAIALKKRKEVYQLQLEQQTQHTAVSERLLLAYWKRQEAMLSYEKVNKEGHFQFVPAKLIEKQKKAPNLKELVINEEAASSLRDVKKVSYLVSQGSSAFIKEKSGDDFKTNTYIPYEFIKKGRFVSSKQMKYDKEQTLHFGVHTKRKDASYINKEQRISVNNESTPAKITGKNTHSRLQMASQSQTISERRASQLAERFHTLKEKTKSTHQMAERVLSGLGYTNFSYRITQSARHYAVNQMRSGDETRDIVTLTDSISDTSQIGYSIIVSASFGNAYKQALIDKGVKELTTPKLSTLKQTLKMKRDAFKLSYLEKRSEIINPVRIRLRKAMRSREVLHALLTEFQTKDQNPALLKKELHLLVLKKRKGLLTPEEADRLGKIRATILLKKAYDAKQKSKVQPRSLLYSIMMLARRAASKSSETGMEGLLKLVDLGTNIYLYKTLKTFYSVSIFLTKKTAKATKYIGQKYLTKTASGKMIKESVKKASLKVTDVRTRIVTFGKQTIKTATATKGGIIAARSVQKTVGAAKMTVLGTKRALTLPRQIFQVVTFLPRKLILIFRAVSTVITKVLLYIGAVLLSVLLVCVLIEFLSSSLFFVLADDEKDEKIDLTPYVSVIEEESTEFSETITTLTTQTASNGTSYENVYYNLSTTDNTKEILSMTAVRFGQELSKEHTQKEIENGDCDHLKEVNSKNGESVAICEGHQDETKRYISHLYNASHLLYTTESDPYDCGNTMTCSRKEKVTEYKYQKISFSKLTGKELLELDLSGYIDVHYDDAGNPLYGYKKMEVTSYRCPETHVDVTVSSVVLTFDDIFATDDISFSSLGDVAFSFESGQDPWMCVDDSALMDGSGYNYGLLSMTSSSGSIQNFMQFLSSYDTDLYQQFDGLTPGTKAFNDKWSNTAWSSDETSRMINAQRSYAWMQYGNAAVTKCKDKTGVDLSRSRALKEVAISRGLNNPTLDWYSGANIKSTMSDEEIIKSMYDYIYQNIETFWPGQTQNYKGLRNRILKEKELLLTLCNTAPDIESDGTSWEGWTSDNIAWAKTIYEQDWDDIYSGYKETYLNWGGSGIAIEIEEKEFAKILEILDSKIGSPYVWGAAGPNTFDCSGLVKYVYETAGVYDFKGLRPTTKTLYAQCIPVPSGEAKQGDLVLWDVPGNIHHVGIYCGNGIVCHAPRTGDYVKFSKLWGDFAFMRLPAQ